MPQYDELSDYSFSNINRNEKKNNDIVHRTMKEDIKIDDVVQ